MAFRVVTVLFFFQLRHALSQSLGNLGVNGGSGHTGGIGDANHPITQAHSRVTDAEIPLTPGSTRQLAHGPVPVRTDASDASGYTVLIDDANGQMQEMVGFGHAWTDSTVDVFNQLEPELLDRVMKELFGRTGNNMGLMRHTIGSSDLSGTPYSYDDTVSGAPDDDLAGFDLGPYGNAMADMMAKMGDYKSDVTVFGSPWSAPAWLKLNKQFIASESPDTGAWGGVNNTLDTDLLAQYSEYFGKYVDAFAARGAKINAITPQNEPLNNQGGYPCMLVEAGEEASLISAGLGEAMQQRDVGIWAYDHNTDEPAYPQQVIDSTAGAVQAAAWHCYESPVANWTVLDDLHTANPNLLQFMTECTNYRPQAGSVNFAVAKNFIRPVQHYASGAAMWVMATNPSYGPHTTAGGCDGCLGSIVVESSTSYTKTNDYYMVGQFSRYIRRGSINYRVVQGNYGSAYTPNSFEIIAVKNLDDSWAVVFMNNYQAMNVSLQFTSGGDVWQGFVDNSTVTTWLLPSLDT